VCGTKFRTEANGKSGKKEPSDDESLVKALELRPSGFHFHLSYLAGFTGVLD